MLVLSLDLRYSLYRVLRRTNYICTYLRVRRSDSLLIDPRRSYGNRGSSERVSCHESRRSGKPKIEHGCCITWPNCSNTLIINIGKIRSLCAMCVCIQHECCVRVRTICGRFPFTDARNHARRFLSSPRFGERWRYFRALNLALTIVYECSRVTVRFLERKIKKRNKRNSDKRERGSRREIYFSVIIKLSRY